MGKRDQSFTAEQQDALLDALVRAAVAEGDLALARERKRTPGFPFAGLVAAFFAAGATTAPWARLGRSWTS